MQQEVCTDDDPVSLSQKWVQSLLEIMAFNEFCRLKMPYDILCMYDHEFRSIGAVTWKYEGFLLRAQARKDNSQCALPTPVFATQASCIYLSIMNLQEMLVGC